jgi:competence protein ComEC
VTAILIGDRTGLPPEEERRLQEAGTYHVIAISGGNIALLTALILVLARSARLPPRSTAAASIALLAFYGYAAGLAPSVLRATIAGMIYLAARAADHRGAALNAIAVAAMVACVTAPLSVLDPGFILSFGATFAIVVAVQRVVPPRATREETPRSRAARIVRAATTGAAALGAATLCAEVALAPVGARLFGRISLAGLFLNFAAIPLMSIIQIAGLAAVLLARVAPAAAAGAGWVAHAGTVGLLRSAALVDLAPWLVRDVPAPAWWLTAAWYSGWAAVLFARRRAIRLPALAAVAASAALLLTGPPFARATRVPPPPSGWTRIVSLDVGQGDATLVEPADAAPFLVDAGGVPGSAFDLGRRVTLPALWAFGVERLSTLALTHGDPDHIGGVPPLLRALAPVAVWEGIPVPRHEPLRLLRAAAMNASVRWRERRAGDRAEVAAVRLRVLNPPPPDWERQRVRNDDSIVLELRIGSVAVLLPGDITQAVEPDVAARVDPASLVIVKAPHHGSAGSSSPRFVSALHPAVVLFSAGQRNPFGHPAPAVVARYRAAGARVFSTAEDGAIVVDTDGEHVVVWCPATGRREELSTRGR